MENLIRGRYGAKTQSFLSSLQRCAFVPLRLIEHKPENPDSDTELLFPLRCHLQ